MTWELFKRADHGLGFRVVRIVGGSGRASSLGSCRDCFEKTFIFSGEKCHPRHVDSLGVYKGLLKFFFSPGDV